MDETDRKIFDTLNGRIHEGTQYQYKRREHEKELNDALDMIKPYLEDSTCEPVLLMFEAKNDEYQGITQWIEKLNDDEAPRTKSSGEYRSYIQKLDAHVESLMEFSGLYMLLIYMATVKMCLDRDLVKKDIPNLMKPLLNIQACREAIMRLREFEEQQLLVQMLFL